jgi:hypothetical protein
MVLFFAKKWKKLVNDFEKKGEKSLFNPSTACILVLHRQEE